MIESNYRLKNTKVKLCGNEEHLINLKSLSYKNNSKINFLGELAL